ncbi:Cation-independent mannose-6-phosphate receptor CI-MPR [Basidiobolus ranarum]|uniref:Cation-independent mannose-6-phosphate receptor CI-MPR n=1 Tax=Basidiobolus ranarum TaxID=34480 RepID=A0ABR2W4Q7_9FUNG
MIYSKLWTVLLLISAGHTLSEPTEVLPDCQVRYHNQIYDLSKLSRSPSESWEVIGIEENHKFRLNICESLGDTKDGFEHRDQVGAMLQGTALNISLGIVNKKPHINSDRLMLRYEGGDTCPNSIRLRSTLMVFECDPWQRSNSAVISFIADWHHCAFWFEVRTPLVCRGIWRWDASFWILLISVTLGVYVVIGGLYNFFRFKARGLDIFPHSRIWRKGLRFFKAILVSFVGLFLCKNWGRRKSNRDYHVLDDGTNLLIEDEFEE